MRSRLRPRRIVVLTLTVLGMAALFTLSGCGTDPVNPDGCQSIEEARCVAAPACPGFGADFDVEACKRFYRDQCLHGLASETDPGEPRIEQCVQAIDLAGECAANGATPCDIGSGTGETANPCDVIESPHKFLECDFLVEAPVGADAGTQDAAPDAPGPGDAEVDAGG